MPGLSVEEKLKNRMMFEAIKAESLPVKVRTRSGGVYEVIECRDNGIIPVIIVKDKYILFPLEPGRIVEIIRE